MNVLCADQHLSFHWTGVDDEQENKLGKFAASPHRDSTRHAIATNLYLAHRGSRWVSYSRDRNHYAAYRWYYGRGYSYNNVLSVVDEFLGSELISEERASPGQLRWQSRIKPTPLFASLLGPVKRVVYAPLQLIRFKDSHGRLVRFQETAQSRKLSRQVCRLNEALASVSISLTSPDIRWDGGPVTIVDGQVVYPTKVQGYRVFNASWHAGGRFYGPFGKTSPS